MLLKITSGVALLLIAVFLAVVFLDHVQHALLKGTEGVALHMHCIVVKRLSRKCVQKKNMPKQGVFFGRTFDYGHDQAKRLPKRLQLERELFLR